MTPSIPPKRHQLVQQVDALGSTILMNHVFEEQNGLEGCLDVLFWIFTLKIHKSEMIADRHTKKNKVFVEETQRL